MRSILVNMIVGERLWRVRRRHDQMDATLHVDGSGWRLGFFRNGRLLFFRQYERREDACAEAHVRLRDLERAGWNTHW